MKKYRYNTAHLVEFNWDLRIEMPRSEQHWGILSQLLSDLCREIRLYVYSQWDDGKRSEKGYTYAALAMKLAEAQQQLGWCCLSQGVDSLLAVLVLRFVCSPDGCCAHAEPGVETWRKVRFWVPVKMEQTEQLLWPHARWAMSWISKDLQHCSSNSFEKLVSVTLPRQPHSQPSL